MNEEEGADYINANYIPVSEKFKNTQIDSRILAQPEEDY